MGTFGATSGQGGSETDNANYSLYIEFDLTRWVWAPSSTHAP